MAPSDDQLLASAVRFLIDGSEEVAARMLLACSLKTVWWGLRPLRIEDTNFGVHNFFDVMLQGPRIAYDVLKQEQHPLTQKVRDALVAVLPSASVREDDDGGIYDQTHYPAYIDSLAVSAEVVNIDAHWRADLLAIARGEGVSNQAGFTPPNRALLTWSNLKFRSVSEIKIAGALDRAGVLFLPNCMARLSVMGGRRNREPDFLICRDGRWGILEVDGEPFHPPSRTSEDHDRDRPFKVYGVRLVEHFDATRCYEDPDGVVQEFLEMLRRA